MLIQTTKGLYCPGGDFYIDPSAAVEHAVITHAHSDHARRGSRNYYVVNTGMRLLKSRLGNTINVHSVDFGQTFRLGHIQLSFHPAGHILGSSQVRMEHQSQVWVASGDYKREPDPTCEPFEVVSCDVFVTEATFGTPAYRWKKGIDVGREIFEWWHSCRAQKKNAILYAYSLGKTQRVLGLLQPFAKHPIYCHPAAKDLIECYRQEGVVLADTRYLNDESLQNDLRGELIIAPQSLMDSKYAPLVGSQYETAFASGWMARNTRGYDRGFLLSDHADWDDLVQTIQQTGAKRVYVQHRDGILVRHLKSLGIEAFPVSKLEWVKPQTREQLSFF